MSLTISTSATLTPAQRAESAPPIEMSTAFKRMSMAMSQSVPKNEAASRDKVSVSLEGAAALQSETTSKVVEDGAKLNVLPAKEGATVEDDHIEDRPPSRHSDSAAKTQGEMVSEGLPKENTEVQADTVALNPQGADAVQSEPTPTVSEEGSQLHALVAKGGSMHGATQTSIAMLMYYMQEGIDDPSKLHLRIRDADFAIETANRLGNSIKQGTDASLLAQANLIPNQVMSLLK